MNSCESYISYCKTECFQNTDPIFHAQTSDYKTYDYEKYNHVLKALCFVIDMKWFIMEVMRNRLGIIVRTSICRTRLSLFRISGFPIGNLIFWEVESRSETVVILIEITWIWWFPCKMFHFIVIIGDFWSRVSLFRIYTWCNGILMILEVKN